MSPPSTPCATTREELLRKIYENPIAKLTLVEDPHNNPALITPGLLAAIDFVRLAGQLRRVSAAIGNPDLYWISLLRTFDDIAKAVIRGDHHPFFEQQAAAISRLRGRPGPTLSEFDSRVAICSIAIAIAGHDKTGAVRRAGAKGYGGKIGIGKSRVMLASHLQKAGYDVTADQLKRWQTQIDDELAKPGYDRAGFRARRAREIESLQEIPLARACWLLRQDTCGERSR